MAPTRVNDQEVTVSRHTKFLAKFIHFIHVAQATRCMKCTHIMEGEDVGVKQTTASAREELEIEMVGRETRAVPDWAWCSQAANGLNTSRLPEECNVLLVMQPTVRLVHCQDCFLRLVFFTQLVAPDNHLDGPGHGHPPFDRPRL